MRAPNSPRPLRASSSSLLAVFLASTVLAIVLLASPASTRSVARRRAIGATTDHGVNVEQLTPSGQHGASDESAGSEREASHRDGSQGISKRDDVEGALSEDGKAPEAPEIGAKLEVQAAIGKSSVTTAFAGAEDVAGSAKVKQEEGIRRFDAVVASDDAAVKIPAQASPAEPVGNSEIGKTVIKGIIVRDAVGDDGIDDVGHEGVPEIVEPSAIKVQRKRSVANVESVSDARPLPADASLPVMEEPGPANESPEAANDAGEKITDFAESPRQVPVLTPVGSSHAKLRRAENVENVPAAEPSLVGETENVADSAEPADLAAAEDSSVQVQAETAQEEIVRAIPELTQAREKSVNAQAEEEVVAPEPKKVVVHEDGLGEVIDDDAEIGNDEHVLSARKSLPISEDSEGDEENEERAVRSDESAKIGDEIPENKETPMKSAAIEQSYSSSLANVMNTQENLEVLKAQAMSLQREIRDEAYLQSLREKATLILPGIPKFTEPQLLDSLRAIASLKNLAETPESSYLSTMDTSILNESQLAILKNTEALLAREQRQTFAENIMQCIRGFDIINCMRIFVWPIIADNLPETFVQNLPTLPIEINVSDYLPGAQQDKPKVTTFRSATGQPHQQRLITPELVVSSILKDALNAEPASISDSLPSLIDPQNETLSKWLTPGQLEILKMGEKFLADPAIRQEYSNRMSSCVRRFEYFSCLKYFAWPMVKQSYPALPDFPDYQSWYPSVTLYPGYPILPYPNAEGIGELPEVVEADATRTRSPRPEAVIVQILENSLRQIPGYPGYQTYQSRQPAPLIAPTVTPEQMAIFYTAQQLIPVQLRADYMAKTMRCIRDYDYLTCTKYSTWPTVRQWIPSLPDLPDFSSWIPTFAVPELPDFSQYIPDWQTLIPGFPGLPGGSGMPTVDPAPSPQPQPFPDKPPQEVNATIISKDEQRLTGPTTTRPASSIENRIILILSNIKWIPLARNAPQIASVTPDSLAVLKKLTYSQLRILGLAKNAIPPPVQGDLDSRFIGCLQGGSDFISCVRNVIWPTLQLYVKNMPAFPEDEARPTAPKSPEPSYPIPAIKPGVYQPHVDPAAAAGQPVFLENSAATIAGRSPIGGQIVAEPEAESAIPISQPQAAAEAAPQVVPTGHQDQLAQLRQGATAKSSDPLIPVISVTDTRFTPIFSDHPETVLLNILAAIQASSKYSEGSYTLEKPGYIESLGEYLNADQKNVIRVSANLLPDEIKSDFMERVKSCVTKSNFIVCSRDVVWPSLAQYYQRLPSFPNFYIGEKPIDSAIDLGGDKLIAPGASAISETNVNTGQHGDAVVTITDTRFVPIFSQHPEAVILSILKNVQSTSAPNLLAQPDPSKTRSPEFTATFTDQQNNIVTVAGNLLPESVRDVFEKRMSECVRENSFLACTRDIAWPTIAQFFPRLPNFPNVFFAIEEPQRPAALLPPQLEPTAKPEAMTPALAAALQIPPGPAGLPSENLVPIAPADPASAKPDAGPKRILAPAYAFYPKVAYIDRQDPTIGSRITDTQVNILRWFEGLLPEDAKPIFVGKVVDCVRSDDFPNCIESCGWPFFRQYVPNLPNFPDLRIYFPRYPQEVPKFPQYPDTQVPLALQNPNFPPVEFLSPHYGYPVQHALDKIIREGPAGKTQQPEHRPDYVAGLEGLTPSVVPALPDGPGALSSGLPVAGSGSAATATAAATTAAVTAAGVTRRSATTTTEGRRQRRDVGEEPPAKYQDISTDPFEAPNELPANITETEFLEILRNITKANGEKVQRDDGDERQSGVLLNSTMKDSLTTEQMEIMRIVEDISVQSSKGLVSQVWQCIRGLSLIRCVGIFVWPIVTQNAQNFIGSFNPFGRSVGKKDETFEEIFGMTSEEFERELLERKENVEEILIDWYRGVVEEKYDNDYGFLRVRGYGDGEIGVSFNVAKRRARGAKIKDSKNMPSILTIISDIMEDVLDSRPEKKDQGKRDRSLRGEDERQDEYNRVHDDVHGFGDTMDQRIQSERSSNDDQIIAMFLEKIKVNGTSEGDGAGGDGDGNNYLSIEDAYDAFELLFGTRLSERMAERLRDLEKNRFRALGGETSLSGGRKADGRLVGNSAAEQSEEHEEKETTKTRSGLVLRLPLLDEEFPYRKTTIGLAELGRKMKMKMSQVVPGISFLISFFIQMALAHARAAASVAGMMSNMALGSAMMSMIRQWFFGSMGQTKVKHVYDNAAMGPGIAWPEHNHHG